MIYSEIISARKNNGDAFHRISKEVISESFSKIESHDTVSICGSLAGVAIVSAFKKSRGRYKSGSFAKSFNEINSHAGRTTFADLRIIQKFLDSAKFDTVLKLLRRNRKSGFKSCLNMLK
ncbi:hypothetical protein [Nitrosopumilus maritimus]|uniref:hypothetical protein n=1 Tax=Nitrosopumilus maritimus TaxID=338192 RepID=UPI000AA7C00B|nr:hypothetical protein [Nitrosopumilus maritimus]